MRKSRRFAALHYDYDRDIGDFHLGFQQHPRQRFARCFAAWGQQRLDKLFPADPPAEILGITIWSTVLWAALAAVLFLVYRPADLSRSTTRQTG